MPLHNRILYLVSAGVVMSTMDSSMINVALPTLMRVYASPLALTEWVVLIYLLTISAILLFWGSLSRHILPGTIYRNGLLIFSLGSLLCSLSPTIGLLIVFRFFQALGASMMMAIGPALIKAVFPPHQLGRGIGMIGIATSVGLMIGPVVSGLLLRWLHWRAIFWVTVPVGFAVYLVGRKTLASLPAQHSLQANSVQEPAGKKSEAQQTSQNIDLRGALLWITSIVSTVLLATHATALCCTGGHNNLVFFLTTACMITSWTCFFVHEHRTARPLLPLFLFRQRFFSMAVVSSTLSFAVLFFVLILIPFYLSAVLAMPPDHIGTTMMAIPLCVFFIAPLAGRIYDHFGARVIATSGLLCCLFSMIGLTCLTEQTTVLVIALNLALLGIGQALFLAPNSAAALSGVSHDLTGITSSILATARNMGMLLGTALAGLIFAYFFSRFSNGLDLKDFTPANTAAFLLALRRTFQAASVLALLAVCTSWLRGKEKAA